MKPIKKLMKFPLILGMLMILGSTGLLAQKYTIAAGWRAGQGPNGIAVKIVPVKGFAIEGTYGIYPFGESATITLQRSRPILCIRRLQFYTGVGAHRRFNYRSGRYTDPINGTFEAIAPPGNTGWGLDAVAGIELKLPIFPILLNAEIKPMVEWSDQGSMLYGLEPAIGIKVAF